MGSCLPCLREPLNAPLRDASKRHIPHSCAEAESPKAVYAGGEVVANSSSNDNYPTDCLTDVDKIFLEASKGRLVAFADLRRQRRQLKLQEKDINNLEKETHALLDVCKDGKFEHALERVRAKPYLVNLRPEVREFAAIHQVVWWGRFDILQELLQLKADTLVKTKDGKTALEVAQEKGHSTLYEVLAQSQREACGRPRLRRSAPESGKLRSFNASFARGVCIAPLIGDRHISVALDTQAMQKISTCLRAEATCLGVSTKTYSSKMSAEVDFCDLIEQAADSEMAATLIFVYTLENFVQKEVNKAARLREEERTNLAPYMRGLHDVLLTGEGLERYRGTTYRVMSMDAAVAQTYRPSTIDLRANLFSWDGFTSATTTPQNAHSNLQVYGANVLVIIEQGAGDHPVLVSKMSEFPSEAEVIYSLGQSFKKRDYYTRKAGDVWAELGVAEGLEDEGDLIVIKVSAEDAFYDFAQDLFRDDGSVVEALPILKARLEWERERKSPWEARAHKELASAYVQDAQYNLAMEHYQISLNQFTARGDPRDIATLNTCIAYVLELQLRYQEALDLHQHVLRYYQECGDAEAKKAIGRIFLAMGMIHTKRAELGDWDEALRLFGEAENICRRYVGDVSIEVATAINCTGEVYHRKKKISEAMKQFEKTLQLRETILGNSHPDTALVLMNIGACYRDKGNNEFSIKSFERAREVYVRAFGPETLNVANVYMQLLPIYNGAGQHETMKDKAEFCYRIYLANLGPEHPSTSTAKAWVEFAINSLKPQ